jgi:hypothetical protein
LGYPSRERQKKEADFGLTDLTKTKASTGEENPPVETNNIETVLDIDLQALTDNDAQAVAALDRLWAEHGRPTESKALIHVIGKTLDYAKLHGIHYPRIFLKRKGQLTRGEFKPDIYEPGKSIKFGKPVAHPAVPKEWVAAATEDFERKFRNERQKGK